MSFSYLDYNLPTNNVKANWTTGERYAYCDQAYAHKNSGIRTAIKKLLHK